MAHKSCSFLLVLIFIVVHANAQVKAVVKSNSVIENGQKLVISKGLNIGLPKVALSVDTVYTASTDISVKVKKIPEGFNDAIASFYLPKGYMVVFAQNSDGTGESVCYVASQSSINKNLPKQLVNNISFIRYTPICNATKKGFASTDSNTVKLLSTSWYYGWSLNRPSFGARQYVPMTWGKGSATYAIANYLIARNDVDHLLSFNEPDGAKQANISVDTAIARYKIMMQTGLRLGAPATTQGQVMGEGRWQSNFMAAAKAQQLRVDFIPLHWYDWGNQTNNKATDELTAESIFNRFRNYVEKVHAEYPDQKLWITEFNVNPTRPSVAIHKLFMKLSTDWMNETDYVERYCYFFPKSMPDLDANGQLTEVAKYWNQIVSPVSFPKNIQ